MSVENLTDRYGDPVPAPHYGQPRYRSIADELRRRIAVGAIPPGALLPPESTLKSEFDVALGTIRSALDVLRAEGLVVTEHGRGTYVRPTYPVRRLGPDRYWLQPQHPADDHASAKPSDGARPEPVDQVDADYRERPATAELAEMFGVQPGTMLLERRLLSRSHGIPLQLTTSYYLLDMVAATPVADPTLEPWPGGHVAQLASLGITVTKIREVIRARMPTTDETSALRLPAGVPVVTVSRKTYVRERVVEAATNLVLPADRTELEYETRLCLG
ncbi:GntR family transcriptional regulator [Micromonospora sonneratiae]